MITFPKAILKISIIYSILLISKPELTRVAYIFAGSVRSFIMPFVHLTIQNNLLQSFCPVESCNYDVFIRISTNDNVHGGLNSNGTLTLGNDFLKMKMNQALDTIKQSLYRNCSLHINFYEIGSQEEESEMNVFTRRSHYHKIYHDLDRRRYSMYFNRLQAYEMMLVNEISNSIKYVSSFKIIKKLY